MLVSIILNAIDLNQVGMGVDVGMLFVSKRITVEC